MARVKMKAPRLFIYVVDRDFGFAPNPFHGYCTLATCKAKLRKSANIGDWVLGVGGRKLQATGRCVFGMRVSDKMTFDKYWANPLFLDKRPIRNGSSKTLVGDNIYHHERGEWRQADSHHSNHDGTINIHNLATDTKADAVLISDHFYYFGKSAPIVPPDLLSAIGYKNRRDHRVFSLIGEASKLVAWLENEYGRKVNLVSDDPFQFEQSSLRYSAETNQVT